MQMPRSGRTVVRIRSRPTAKSLGLLSRRKVGIAYFPPLTQELDPYLVDILKKELEMTAGYFIAEGLHVAFCKNI